MNLKDYKDPKIERDINDPRDRVPRFVQDIDSDDKAGVLYIPSGIAWNAKAFSSPKEAIKFLDKTFGEYQPRKPLKFVRR